MKKRFSFIVVVGMALFLLLGSPILSFANTSSSENKVELAATKKIEGYRVVYNGLITAPKTYYYNVRGWTGTLSKDSQVYTDEKTFAYYSGTVSCLGTCVMNSNDK